MNAQSFKVYNTLMCVEEFYKQHPQIDEKTIFELVDVNGAFNAEEIEEIISSSKSRISCVRPSKKFALTPIADYEIIYPSKSIGNRYPGFVARGRDYGSTFIEVYISLLKNEKYNFFIHFSLVGQKEFDNRPKITFSHNIPSPEDPKTIYNVSYGFAVSKDDLFPKKFDDYMMLK